jgi:peptidoglycan/xylan/chitin deacetylase (PgdA/CDA1 family)
MEFGSHTVNHHILPKETSDELDRQLVQSKAVLEQHTHKPVVALAYPTGAYSPAVVARVPEAGYRAAVGIFPGIEQRPAERFMLHRVSVGYGTPLRTFGARLLPPTAAASRP